jgi:drug/metabolite transporter (DMT)-like permease
MSVPAAFTGVILIWSTTPLAIQWSSEGGGFLFGVMARMVLGLGFCLVAIRIGGIEMPWHTRARGAYLVAGMAIYGAMTLVYWGAQYVPSGWIAVLFGLRAWSSFLQGVRRSVRMSVSGLRRCCCRPPCTRPVRSGSSGFRAAFRRWR